MSSDGFDDGDCYEPKRDQRGRFAKGCTGNPDGRPRKGPDPEWSVDESFARALAEEVTVSGSDGSKRKMPLRDVLITSAVRDAVKAKGKDKMYIIERLAKLQFLRAPAQEEDDPIFTDDDRRELERIKRAVIPHICCQCDKPIYKGNEWHSTRDDFRFG